MRNFPGLRSRISALLESYNHITRYSEDLDAIRERAQIINMLQKYNLIGLTVICTCCGGSYLFAAWLPHRLLGQYRRNPGKM